MSSSTKTDSAIPRAEPRSLLLPAGLLAAVTVFFGVPGLGGEAVDLWFQAFFWDGQSWLVPHDHPLGMVLAYRGPKGLIILAAVGLIGLALFRPRRRARSLPAGLLRLGADRQHAVAGRHAHGDASRPETLRRRP